MAKTKLKKEAAPGFQADDSRLRALQRFLPPIIGFMSILALMSFYLSWWLLDIYVSFIPQIVITLVALYVIVFAIYGRFIVRDGWKSQWASVSALDEFVLFFSAAVLFYVLFSSVLIIDTGSTTRQEPNLKVATYNINYQNSSIDRAAKYFKQENIDILALEEARPEFVEEARQILDYPYSYVTDCDCSAEDTEVAIISKYPIGFSRSVVEHQNGIILRSEIQLDHKKRIAVYAVHISPPFNNSWYQLRNDFIAKLSEQVVEENLPTIVMGDFNTTIFSPVMQDFISSNESVLDNIAEYSWPKCSWNKFSNIVCARIDHIFVASQFELGKRYMGENFGSDHKPVIAEIAIN